MKNPLYYQLSDYDCGPTSVLNAVAYLFEREDIPPEILRNVMLYCLDCHSFDGAPGKLGTSTSAMMFLSNWLDNFGRVGIMPISSSYLAGDRVYLGSASSINDALKRGGVVVVRLFMMSGTMFCLRVLMIKISIFSTRTTAPNRLMRAILK